MKRLMSVVVVLLLSSFAVEAQILSIEVLKPQFVFAGAKPTFSTTAWFATLQIPLYKHFQFVGQLPFAHAELKDGRVPAPGNTIGNPAFGLRLDHEKFHLDFGLRLPFAKTGFAGFVGALADIDRQEAFVPDIIPLYGMIKTKLSLGKFSIRPYGGATFTVKIERDQLRFDYLKAVYRTRANDGEFFLLYGGEGGLEFGKFYLGGAYNARTWLTSGASFGTSSVNQVTLRAKLDFAKVVPGAIFRFPIDDILLDNLFGVYCTFNL